MNKGIVFTALSALFYGSIGYFGVRLLEQGFDVANMLFWRFFLSCLLLLPLVPRFLSLDKFKTHKKAFASLFFLGATFHGLGTATYFEATKSIGTGLAMVLFFTYPIFVVGLSRFLKNIALTPKIFASLLLIIIGCALIASGSYSAANFDLRGLLLALSSGLCYGTYVFYSKELSGALSPALATFIVCLGTTCALALYMLFTAQNFIWPESHDVWLLLGLFALIGTVLPVLLLLAGIIYLPASTASIISVLEPVAVLGVGTWILGESLYPMQIFGALVILSATLLIYIKPRRPDPILD